MAHSRPFTKILVPFDGSSQSLAALNLAILMAKRENADLTAISVSSTPTALPMGPGGGGFDRIISESQKEARELLDRVKEKAVENDLKIKTEVLNGIHGIGPAIVDYAESKGSDLIVMGTRGRTKLKKMLLGSVAQAVVTYAPCTVMVVR